jgi:hypothetical protein
LHKPYLPITLLSFSGIPIGLCWKICLLEMYSHTKLKSAGEIMQLCFHLLFTTACGVTKMNYRSWEAAFLAIPVLCFLQCSLIFINRVLTLFPSYASIV